MRKVFKSKIFAFILGALIFSMVSAVSASTYAANQVGFNSYDNGWNVSDTNAAINNLRARINPLQRVSLIHFNYLGTSHIQVLKSLADSYDKLMLIDKNLYTGSYCSLYIQDNGGTKQMALTTNQEYNLSELFDNGYIKLSVASDGWCWILYSFYN